jgi:hypothetical protein
MKSYSLDFLRNASVVSGALLACCAFATENTRRRKMIPRSRAFRRATL